MTSAAGYEFALTPELRVSAGDVGPAREPVLVVDDLLREPQTLIDYAASEVEFSPAWTDQGGYPGLRAPAPLNYVQTLARALSPTIEKAWVLRDVKLVRADCYLSLVTRRPQELHPFQRIPHIDTVDPLRFALLHYLCPAGFGGTAFYRHRSTGLQVIGAGQETTYLAARDRELESAAPESGYIEGGTATYECIARIEDRFNRLLIYRSCHLHCGQIPADMNFSTDPRRGRLTANVFVSYAPRS